MIQLFTNLFLIWLSGAVITYIGFRIAWRPPRHVSEANYQFCWTVTLLWPLALIFFPIANIEQRIIERRYLAEQAREASNG